MADLFKFRLKYGRMWMFLLLAGIAAIGGTAWAEEPPFHGAGGFPYPRAAHALFGLWALAGLMVVALGVGAGVIGWAHLVRALSPRRLAILQHVQEQRPVFCFVLGLLNWILAMVLWHSLLKGRPVLSLPFWCLIWWGAVSGMAGQIQALGERLSPSTLEESSDRPGQTLWRGGAALILSFLVPFLGQLLFLISISCGLGAAIVSIPNLHRKQS